MEIKGLLHSLPSIVKSRASSTPSVPSMVKRVANCFFLLLLKKNGIFFFLSRVLLKFSINSVSQ
jgi:hypothetical protein